MQDLNLGVEGLYTADSLKYLQAIHFAQRELEEAAVYDNLMKDASFCSLMRCKGHNLVTVTC